MKNERSYYYCGLLSVMIILCFRGPKLAAMCLLGVTGVVLTHELSHLVVAKLLGFRIRAFSVRLWGGWCMLAPNNGTFANAKFLLIALAGPFGGGVVAYLIDVLLSKVAISQNTLNFLDIMLIAIYMDTYINLLPFGQFDGSRALDAAFEMITSVQKSLSIFRPVRSHTFSEKQTLPFFHFIKNRSVKLTPQVYRRRRYKTPFLRWSSLPNRFSRAIHHEAVLVTEINKG